MSEIIKDNFYFENHGDLRIVVDKNTGYFNATKLCAQRKKFYKHWIQNKRTKNLLAKVFCENKLPIYEIKQNNKYQLNKQISGTYIPIELIDDLIQWINSNPEKDTQGIVYIITSDIHENNNIYKIGYTINLKRRLEQFNAYRLEEVEPLFRVVESFNFKNAYKAEQNIHKKLEEFRINCTEFFKCDLQTIKDVILQEE